MNKIALTAVLSSAAIFGALAMTTMQSATALQPGATIGTAKVASVNFVRVLNELQERKELQTKLETMAIDTRAEVEKRQNALKGLNDRRKELKEDSADYLKISSEMRQGIAELNTLQQVRNAELQAFLKSNLRVVAEKIANASAEIAKEQGVGLVVNENYPILPADLDPVTVEQVQQAIGQRSTFYTSPEADLTSLVITRLDAAYKSGK